MKTFWLWSRLVCTTTLLLAAAACGGENADEFVARGRTALEEKRPADAIIEFRRAVQVDPKHGEARLALAKTYADNNDLGNALREYVRAADLLPEDNDTQLRAGSYLLLSRQFQDAQARADGVLARDPGNVNAQILRGNALAGLKDFKGAVADYEAAIATDPKNLSAYVSLGTIQFLNKESLAAEASFKKAIDADPKSVTARVALANYYWATQRQVDAEAALKSALEVEPDALDVHRALGVFYMSSGRLPEAESHFKSMAALAPTPESRGTLASYYVIAKRYDEARTLLTELATAKDSGSIAVVRLAALDVIENQRAAAESRLRELLAKDATFLPAQLLFAEVLMRGGKRDEAQAAVSASLAIDQTSARAHELNAMLLASADRTADAIKEYEQVLAYAPRSLRTALELGRLYLAAGSAEKGRSFAQQALTIDATQPDAQSLLVRSYLMQGNTRQARLEVEKLQKQFPNALGLHILNALVAISAKDFPAARAAYGRALQMSPGNLEALDGMLRLDLSERKGAAGVARLEAAMAAREPSVDLLTLTARAHVANGDRAKAEELLKRAIEKDPARLASYSLLGELYARENRLGEARTQFEGLLQRNPQSVSALTMVGMILEQQGSTEEAEKFYARALAVDPKAPIAANNLAWIYVASQRKLDEALQLAQGAKERLPDEPGINDTLGWIYVKKNMAEQAIEHLEHSVELKPTDPVFHYHLGMAYMQQGHRDRAKQSLAKALSLRGDFEGAAEARQALGSL
jgi:putative PEP-CTERM system TPR-repeat lipoprotein